MMTFVVACSEIITVTLWSPRLAFSGVSKTESELKTVLTRNN